MLHLICLGLFIPLIGFFVLSASSHTIGRRLTGFIGCGTIFLSFLCFASLLFLYTSQNMSQQTMTLFQWIHFDKINADFTLRLDHLSLLMALIITGVGFLIHVYSNGYMDHDKDYARFFAFLNFFVFAMLLLVLAGDLLVLFVGWEGVGLASYLLIGFWYERTSAAQAAVKAFVVNRVGDVGFLLGLLLTYHTFGTTDIVEITQKAGQQFVAGASLITLLTFLFFIGATGKSAQLPLHTWLPDAMEGPTPVSALIHAATMVTAGVYLIVRLHPLYLLAPTTLEVVGYIGGATSLFASLCAMAQTDLKRVLAYSTVSQLGLMFLACGAGAFYAAMFHLTMHAFMKALLFLAAGNVVHMMHDTTEMAKMGGLAKIFTKTHWLFLVGVLAMSGIPPLAAFFSKDLILEIEFITGDKTLFYIALAASILTAFYLTRAYCLTFLGKPRSSEEELKSVKEAPSVMLLPVTVLAVLSLLGGFLGFAFGRIPLLESFLSGIGISPLEMELTTHLEFSIEMLMSVFGGLLGIIVAAFMYTKYIDQLENPIQFFRKAFYIDEIYDAVFVTPLKAISGFIDNFFEPKVFDRSLRVASQGTKGMALTLQHMQSGEIRSYVAWMVLGAVLLTVFFAF